MYDRVIKDDRAFIFWVNYPFKHCVRGRGLFWILKSRHFILLAVKTLHKPSNWRHQRRKAIPDGKYIFRFWLKMKQTKKKIVD